MCSSQILNNDRLQDILVEMKNVITVIRYRLATNAYQTWPLAMLRCGILCLGNSGMGSSGESVVVGRVPYW